MVQTAVVVTMTAVGDSLHLPSIGRVWCVLASVVHTGTWETGTVLIPVYTAEEPDAEREAGSPGPASGSDSRAHPASGSGALALTQCVALLAFYAQAQIYE